MKTTILNMASAAVLEHGPEIVLSFRPFIEYLKKRRDETNCSKSRFLAQVINRFEEHPELLQSIDLEDTSKYPEQLQLIYNTLAPIAEDEKLHRWALCMPLMPIIFYSTDAYFNLVADIATGDIRKSIRDKDPAQLKVQKMGITYALILEKLFNMPSFFNRELVHSLRDKQTGFPRYYQMNIDTRFIEVTHTRPLPELNITDLQSFNHDVPAILEYLDKVIPLDMFRFEGFAINNVKEVTAQYAIDTIKNTIVNRASFDESSYYATVIESLKTLAGNMEIEFGLLPHLKVNDKLIISDGICSNSRLLSVARKYGLSEETYMSLADAYFKNPKLLFYSEITAEDEAKKPFLTHLKKEGIRSYALLPVFFNNTVAGLLEVYSPKKGLIDEALFARLDPAIPLLAQLLKNNIEEFHESINRVIKEKFTSIQPSVQWKFNEVAWHYLRDKQKIDEVAEPEEIKFEEVHALYGSIDIRDSTVERNIALNKDLEVQFTILLNVLNKLKRKSGFGLIDAKIYACQQWLERIKSPDFNRDVEINDFLENELRPFLEQFRVGNPEFASIMEEYFQAIDEHTGVAHENRRRLEASMNAVISSVNNYLVTMKEDIQKAYPSYFEKFRTDGVEYDIYIGQSMAPEKPYNDIYLKNLRLLQLTSMSAIAKRTHALLSDLDQPVKTTQLIFIHSHPININFRKDEKRFDVEGAYNIRYQVVKKRIDKVRIKHTNERLTQPNKIALVYFNDKEADEYVSYIRYLQGENILRDDLEYVELEELQGVSGLKALRVGVIVE